MGGDTRAEGAFGCLQPRPGLLEGLQVGVPFLGRMSLIQLGVPLLRSWVFVFMEPGECSRTSMLW